MGQPPHAADWDTRWLPGGLTTDAVRRRKWTSVWANHNMQRIGTPVGSQALVPHSSCLEETLYMLSC